RSARDRGSGAEKGCRERSSRRRRRSRPPRGSVAASGRPKTFVTTLRYLDHVLRRALLAATVAALVSCGGVFAYLLTPARAGAAGTTSTSTSTSTATVTTAAKSVLVLRGHGWGHGLGMSQWGAKGYADHGWTYDRILA